MSRVRSISAFRFCRGVCIAINANCVAYLSDLGHSAQVTGLVASVVLIFLTIGKIGFGEVFDRLGDLKGALLMTVMVTAAPLLFLLARNTFFAFFSVALLGLAGRLV